MDVFACDASARHLAFAGRTDRVGQPLPGTPARERSDAVRQRLQTAARPAGGRMEYATPHPVTGEMRPKTSYVRLGAEGVIAGCGIYRMLQAGQTRRRQRRLARRRHGYAPVSANRCIQVQAARRADS